MISRSCAGAVDVALVEAGEHLEIGRHAIRRLRQRPELVATRILLCIEVARVSGLDPEMGADDFILMPVSAEELAARLRQLHARDKRPGSPLQVRYGEVVLDCEMRQAYLRGQVAGADALRIPAAALPGRSRGPRVHAAGAAVARLGLPPRRPRAHRRHARAEPARQAGRAWASACSRCAAWATSCSAPTPRPTSRPSSAPSNAG